MIKYSDFTSLGKFTEARLLYFSESWPDWDYPRTETWGNQPPEWPKWLPEKPKDEPITLQYLQEWYKEWQRYLNWIKQWWYSQRCVESATQAVNENNAILKRAKQFMAISQCSVDLITHLVSWETNNTSTRQSPEIEAVQKQQPSRFDLGKIPWIEHLSPTIQQNLLEFMNLRLNALLPKSLEWWEEEKQLRILLTQELTRYIDIAVKWDHETSQEIAGLTWTKITQREYDQILDWVQRTFDQLLRDKNQALVHKEAKTEQQALQVALNRYYEVKYQTEIRNPSEYDYNAIERIKAEWLNAENVVDLLDMIFTWWNSVKFIQALESGDRQEVNNTLETIEMNLALRWFFAKIVTEYWWRFISFLNNKFSRLKDRIAKWFDWWWNWRIETVPSQIRKPSWILAQWQEEVGKPMMMKGQPVWAQQEQYRRLWQTQAREIAWIKPWEVIDLSVIKPSESTKLWAYIENNALDLLDKSLSTEAIKKHVEVASSLAEYIDKYWNQMNKEILRFIDEYLIDLRHYTAKLWLKAEERSINLIRIQLSKIK